MPETQFKISQLNGQTRLVEFPDIPTWEALASKLEPLYAIPSEKVGVTYIDNDNDEITLSSNDELQNFYRRSHLSDKVIKFKIFDLTSAPAGGEGKQNITPSSSMDTVNDIEEKVKAELLILEPAVRSFLNNPELPAWVPPQFTVPDYQEFLAKLQIPMYRNHQPSLLLHGLDKCDGQKIKEAFDNETPICIVNTSGSGKTRHIMEALTVFWGFYVVTTRDANGVGIRDLQDALELIGRYRQWVPDLHQVPADNRAAQDAINNQIASRAFRRVLAARIVVFELFLQVAIQVDGCLQEKHKRIWLLFQLFDQLDPRGGALHPFTYIINKLRNASDDALDKLIVRLSNIVTTYFPYSRLILGLDEAQWAARLYPCSGMSSSNPGAFRSIIREMVRAFSKAQVKLVVSGTGVLLADLEDSVASGVGKPRHIIEVFHELGMFETWPEFRDFLQRYIPVSLLYNASGYHLQQRMREYLMGRYRFCVSFVECFLMNGLHSPHKLLNEYLYEHLDCFPGDIGDPFISDEPDLHIKVTVKGFDWDRLQLDSNATQEALSIVRSHMTRGQSPLYGPVTARLVEYGIARLRQDPRRQEHHGHIVEPLAFLSIMRWLQRHSTTSVAADLRREAADSSGSRGYAFEHAVALYLLQRLRYPVPLSTVFDFHSEHTPPWANEEAHLVARLDGAGVPVDITGKAPQNPGLGVVVYAESINEIIHWIEGPDSTPAILIPSPLFGPDILTRVKLSSSTSLTILIGQDKSYTTGNKESLDSATLSNALISMHPDHWFKLNPQRQKLIDVMKKHNVLRFVAGYPLPPNLNATAKSVKKAISGFDSKDALASTRFDDLRQHFKSEGAVDVLEPMDVALTYKRKAGEIS